jgi:silicon transporter
VRYAGVSKIADTIYALDPDDISHETVRHAGVCVIAVAISTFWYTPNDFPQSHNSPPRTHNINHPCSFQSSQFAIMNDDPLYYIKTASSVILLLFSIVIVCALIFGEQTSMSQHVPPVVAFLLLWICLGWLSVFEGGQASLVGLPPIDRKLYKSSHPISHAICEYGHCGDNLDRFLIGRQFMVLALVFVINLAGAPVKDAAVLGLPTLLTNIFLRSGLAMILITCMVGQLTAQINASHCMLDYIDTHVMTITLYVAMGIEASGLLHASYLIQIIVAFLAGKPIESNEPPRKGVICLLFWCRVFVSTALLTFALVVTGVALLTGRTTMYKGVPPVVAMVLTLVLWSVVGFLEGMQIAFFAVSKLSDEERSRTSPWAQRTCDLLFYGDGRNLPGFMVGRQLCVVACFFFAARLTTLDIGEGEDNVLGVPDSVQDFFNTGLLGALSTTIVASIAWQLVASAFPMAFLSTPITYYLLRLCLLLEWTGLCNGAWMLAGVHKRIARFQKDEIYFGTAEDRAAGTTADSAAAPAGGGAAFRSQTGHLTGGAFPAGKDLQIPHEWELPIMARRSEVLSNIKILYELICLSETEAEKEVYRRSLARDVATLGRLDKEHGKTAVAYMKQKRASFFLQGR